MKKFLLRFSVIIILSISILFGSTFLLPPTTNPLLESAYADPDSNGEQQDDPRQDSNTQDTSNTNKTDNANSDTETPDKGTDENSDESANEDSSNNESTNVCSEEAGSTSWALCSMLGAVSNFVDSVYGFINELLVVKPIATDHDSAVYKVWQKACEITNIVFVIFVLVVIYSQITGFGINNYGIKRVLPRIIVAVIMVNLSFIICSVLVDISNLLGSRLVGFFNGIQAEIQLDSDPFSNISWGDLFGAFTGTAVVGFVAIQAMGGIGAAFWMLVIVLLGALISVIVGLLTISLRQGVVLLLIMVAPLAFVAYLLPNTEKWFQKWKSLLAQMLVFYPMFSLLYGASKLAGWAIISTANENAFFVILGFGVQVMPLFLSISLMKMSNTVLGGFSRALDRFSNPMRNAAGRWGNSHAENHRQRRLYNNRVATGARLQNYLNYRQQRRELDTGDMKSVIANRNLARTLRYRSSNRGLDATGKDTWRNNPNRSTRIAKEASLQSTVAAAAQQNFTNTLGEYGDIFKNDRAKALGAAHGEAYLDIMSQQFRAENIAQGDQNFLLGRYLGAVKDQYRNPYEFNRLVGGATGKLGHAGETTIMGQVIKRSAEIEERRRAEARIVTTKFGVRKGDYRGMILNKARVNDDGFEEDENGKQIEDSQYRFRDPVTGANTSAKHREWGQYIGVHNTHGTEISKEEYDTLSDAEREKYTKVKYMNIYDDNGDVVQRVYDDDAGYMKEMLRKDIAIGDPINRRYATEIGLKLPDADIARLQAKYPDIDWSKVNDTNRTGILRRYHSTIAGALQETKYAEHAGEFTAMLTAQLDNGYITSVGQRNIAGLDSLIKAAKSGKLLQNDAIIIKDWTKILNSIRSDAPEGERFEDYFPDLDIALSRNVNGMELKGLRLSTGSDGHLKWREIKRSDPTMTIEDMRNWVKHRMIPDAAKKVLGSTNRNISPTILDSLKPEGVDAFVEMLKVIGEMGLQNAGSDPNIPFEDRLNPDNDIFANRDPREMKKTVQYYSNLAQQLASRAQSNSAASDPAPSYASSESGGSSGGSRNGNNSQHESSNNGIDAFNHDLFQTKYADSYTTDYETAARDIMAIFEDGTSLREVCDSTRLYFENHYPLSNPDTMRDIEFAINEALADSPYRSTYDAIDDITDDDISAIADFYEDVIAITNHTFSI